MPSVTYFKKFNTTGPYVLEGGKSADKHWNNAPAGRAWLISADPLHESGMSTSAQVEVKRVWHVMQPTGEHEVWFTVHNPGMTRVMFDVYIAEVGP